MRKGNKTRESALIGKETKHKGYGKRKERMARKGADEWSGQAVSAYRGGVGVLGSERGSIRDVL